jgi:hypothetical protein
MSTVTHERLDYVIRHQRARNDQRVVVRTFVRRAAALLIGAAVMISTVAAVVGVKAAIFLTRLPLVP